MKDNTRIVCAMSGGVDSSVAALLLKDKGYDVVGVTMRLWSCFRAPARQTCCSADDSLDAMRVCVQLGIPHHIIDMRELFKREVIGYFTEEYSRGRTPNPCIKCNERIKFGLLRDECRKLFGTDIIATGHYAVARGGRLYKGADAAKDQSYFLFTLTEDDLNRTVFPLGGLTKGEVRRLADDAGLRTAGKGESQEVCFIPDGDYPGFIRDNYPGLARPAGNFVDLGGRVMGRHEGTHAYTIGQRRGLGLGFGKRRYVVAIDVERNEVVLGDNGDLMRKEAVVRDMNWIDRRRSAGNTGYVTAKIRYRHEGAVARLEQMDGGAVRVIFDRPQRAVTPGQAAVFYDGDEVLGGGWIV